ncbi:uncharacterized protein BX664DRAFT_327586 [Halteromyces radiatus]|uniref:uncharacterized protein n=1 Tax=Halteromyces radiatus TaxID=101107 RepID=UPI00221F272D|nr:uncharacterized protein BX664DRAFT_327586 [Halteromyces radiatus]KAI8092558.1 hypothetical protein BX664DRAFT_327586 [Halteromyces radiatus]
MSNPLDHCLERLHLTDNTKLRERAGYYQGQCSSKVPTRTFSKGPNSQHVISIQLAYESLGMFGWNSKLAAELAGCNQKTYESTLSAVRKHLNLKSTITFDTLGVAFGSTILATHAQDFYTFFVEQHIAKLGPAQQVSAKEQLNSAIWKAAAFYVCSKAVGTRLDKTKLQNLCTCGSIEFNKSVTLIQQECETKLEQLKKEFTVLTRSTRKRKATESVIEATNDNEGSIKEKKTSKNNNTTKTTIIPHSSTNNKKKNTVSGIVSMINLQDYRDSKKYKDYINWEQQIKQRLST